MAKSTNTTHDYQNNLLEQEYYQMISQNTAIYMPGNNSRENTSENFKIDGNKYIIKEKGASKFCGTVSIFI
jgi:hypothetical protein